MFKLFDELKEAGETASLSLLAKGGKSPFTLHLLPSTSTTAHTSRFLQVLCSPHPDSGTRQVMSCVGRLDLPTFSNLDGAPHLLHQRHTANCWGKACSPNSMYTTTSLSSTTLPHDPPEPGPTSPLPPPCFTDPHPLCCHCTGTCPCSSGAP